MSSLLTVKDLSVRYGVGDYSVMAIDQASLTIPTRGHTVGIVGESGSGKTTMGLSIMNLIEPPGRIVSGKIEFEGSDVTKMSKAELRHYRWQSVSMVFQSAMNSLSPVKTVVDHISEVFREHLGLSKSEARERSLKLLSQVGIPESRATAYAHELSGGMKQRVVIAMALALSPALLIADEPTSALDVVVQRQILSLLKDYVKQQNLSLIFITHEIAILEGLVDNIAVMHKGKVVEFGPIDNILYDPLHPYTERLLGSILSLDTEVSEISSSPVIQEVRREGVLGGCNYADVCKYYMERCSTAHPEMIEVRPGRWVACYKRTK